MAYSRGEQINPIIGLGACAACWAHPTEYLLWVHFLVNAWTLEVFGGHTSNECHRWTTMVDTFCDGDARFGK